MNAPVLWVRGTALLCDLDGTLVDSSGSVGRAWRRWVEHRAGDFTGDLDALLTFQAGRVAAETIAHFAPGLSATEVDADDRAHLAGQAEDSADTTAFPGVATVLGELVRLGARWGVVTSADARLARVRLEAAGLPAPPVLITADDVDAPKPDPEGFVAAATALGVAGDTVLVVEDSPAGVAAGVAAGARVLHVGDAAVPGHDRVTAFCWADVVDIRGSADDVVLHLR